MRGLGKNNQQQTNPQSQQRGNRGSSNQERVDIYQDSSLEGNTVRAEYQLDENGVVKDVYIRAGKNATDVDIEMHQQTTKVMQMYGGTLGKIRKVEAKIAKKLGIKGQPQIGTKAWEAQLEVEKLNRVVEKRMGELSVADGDRAIKLKAEIEYLQEQLDTHSRTFEAMDESGGVGFVAAFGTYTPDQIKQITSNLKIGDEVKGISGKGKIIKIDQGNVTMELTMTRGRGKGQTMTITTPTSQYGNSWELAKSSSKRPTKNKRKTSNKTYVSPYKDSIYSNAEKITLAKGWNFQTGEVILTIDKIAADQLDIANKTKKAQSNRPNQIIEIDPKILGNAAVALDDFTTEKKYKVGETVTGNNSHQDIGYRHFPAKDSFGNPVGRIGGLESGKGFTYPQLAARLRSVDVGDRLDKLRKQNPLPNDEFSPIIGELYGLWFAKEGSHPWRKDKKTGKRRASNEHRRDLIYSEMIVDLMKSGMTFEEAIKLHPAAFNGAQAGARIITDEMNEQDSVPVKSNRKQRDERYRREKETIQTWFNMYIEQLEQSGKQPTKRNLEQFIKNKL